MNGTRKWVGIAPVVTLCLILGSLTSLGAQTPAAGQDSGATKAPAYTLVEYNAEQACAAEKVPATGITRTVRGGSKACSCCGRVGSAASAVSMLAASLGSAERARASKSLSRKSGCWFTFTPSSSMLTTS